MGDLLGGERTANLGRPEEALQEFEEAARVWRMTPTENRTRVIAIGLARVLRKQADLLSYSDPERSMRLIQDARQRLLPVFDANPEDTEVLRGFYLALESQGNALCEGEPTEPRLTQALALFVEHRDLALRIATAHPKNMVFARDTALALRKIGWTRAKLGQRTEAEAAYRTSLARLEANAAAAPEHVRHGRDVSWGCWFLSETVLERGGTDEGATLLVRCAAMIVTTCVREPSSADYRTDVGKLVPAACEVLLEITRAEMAESVRRDALVRLQPVLEASPDNLALSEVLRRLRAIEAASARKSG
jgi:tetratricopeptide (TPR) repeat protein